MAKDRTKTKAGTRTKTKARTRTKTKDGTRTKTLFFVHVGNSEDHTTGEILAWVVGRGDNDELKTESQGHDIDAVRVPRQPGSALKPFLYALALDSGWSPATILDDTPMALPIGFGLHHFHNYSHAFYGKISLREALGNSLNIPALETIAFVGRSRYLDILHALKFDSLTKRVEFYKEGLALGTGEVTLFEMVQAYSALANGVAPQNKIEWFLNGKLIGTTQTERFLWAVERGEYSLQAKATDYEGLEVSFSDAVGFTVK